MELCRRNYQLTYLHPYVHRCIDSYMCTYDDRHAYSVHTYILTHRHRYRRTCTDINTHRDLHTDTHICTYVLPHLHHITIHIYLYSCVQYIYIYTYIYICTFVHSMQPCPPTPTLSLPQVKKIFFSDLTAHSYAVQAACPRLCSFPGV